MHPRAKLARFCVPLVALSVVASLAGCVTTAEGDGFHGGPAPTLEFPDAQHLETWGEYHNVQLVIERSAVIDPIPAVMPRSRADTEFYDFGEGHLLEFRKRFFHVGKHTYTAGDNSVLHVFLIRPGDWTFKYRGVEITVEAEAAWKPAVQWAPTFQEGTEGRTVGRRRGRSRRTFEMRVAGRLEREVVKVGRHTIIFEPGKPYLEINGERWLVDRLGVQFRLDRRGGVKLSK